MKSFTNFTPAILTVLLTTLSLGLYACVQEPVDGIPGNPLNVLPKDPGSEGNQTVQGIDSDGDGLRDDVQIQVHKNYPDPATRAAVTRLAKAFQLLLTTGTEKSQALTAAISMNKAIDCLYSLDAQKFGERVDGVEEMVVNTEARARAYAKAGAFLSGGSYSVSTVADNAASCEGAL